MYKTIEELPLTLKVEDVQSIFNIGKRQAYELVHAEGFLSMKVGSSIRIYKPQLMEWIKQRTQEQLL